MCLRSTENNKSVQVNIEDCLWESKEKESLPKRKKKLMQKTRECVGCGLSVELKKKISYCEF